MGIGLLIGAAVASGGNLQDAMPVVAAALIGSLLPDIDHAGSFISRRVRLPIYALLQHRGFTHSLLCVALMVALCVAVDVSGNVATAFFAGYLSHMAADALTRSGIQAFYPSKANARLLPKPLTIRTGGAADALIGAACFLASLALLQRML